MPFFASLGFSIAILLTIMVELLRKFTNPLQGQTMCSRTEDTPVPTMESMHAITVTLGQPACKIVSMHSSIADQSTSKHIHAEDGSLALDLPVQSLPSEKLALAAPLTEAGSANKLEDTTSKYLAAYASLFLAERELQDGASKQVCCSKTCFHYDSSS